MREYMALVHISALDSVACAVRTQLLVSSGTRQGTEFTAGSPATAAPATALHPGDCSATARRGLACGLQHFGEAGPLPDVLALGEGRAGLEALVTVAPEAACGVDAVAVGTEPGLGAALILIYAALPRAKLGLQAQGADTGEGANEVLAQHAPGVAVLLAVYTLVHILAHGPVLSQGVAGWAGARVGAFSVEAAEGTKEGVQGALVDVLTGHHGAGLKAISTGTFKASDDVGAGAFPTGVPKGAFVCVHTTDACEVQAIAEGTLAAKRAVGVDTMTIGTDTRVLCTLVHILPRLIRAWDCPMAKGAELLEGSTALLRTKFAGVVPALTRPLAATAPALGGVESFGHRAPSAFKMGEAETLPCVKATASIVRQVKARQAEALETPRAVGTGAKEAEVGLL